MRDPYDPYADELAMATPLPEPKNLDDPDNLDPEPDYQGAAKRGITAIRAQMGWTQPTTPGNGQKPAHGPHSPSNRHPNTTPTP